MHGPPSGRRRWGVSEWASAATVVGTLITVLAWLGISLSQSKSPEPGSGEKGKLSFANQSLPVPSELPQPLEARVYFGQLEAIISRLSSMQFKIDQGFRGNHKDLCVETVLVSKMPGPTGWVVATGVGEGWGRVEQHPDIKVGGPEHSVHQQLIIPPLSAATGAQWTGGAEVSGDGIAKSIATGTFTLSLNKRMDSMTEWDLDGRKVECSMK